MVVLEALQASFLALIVGYLSMTNTVAMKIGVLLSTSVPQSAPTESISTHEPSSPSEALILLSRSFASTEGVSQILKGDQDFQESLHTQQAALVLTAGDPITDEAILASLVNILCEYRADGYVRTTTGTGFFISENGVILTNAHVAQFLLLQDLTETIKDARCIVRTGNPAIPRFRAELLFLSPTWVLNNAELISVEKPRGTGENDYALLYVTEGIERTPLPRPFPSLPFSAEFLSKKRISSTVRSAGYPAEKILTEGVRAELEPHVASTTIEELYTFGSNYADIMSLSASSVGEHGASGGPVVDARSGVIGLIVTKGKTKDEYTKSLRALTLSYIDRTIQEETGFSLTENMQGDLTHRSKVFRAALTPFLARLLSYEL